MLTAFYDGNCVICQSTCETMRALDWLRRIEFVDLHEGSDMSRLGPELSRERLLSEIHVLDEAGVVYAGFAGARRMLKEAPLGLPLWLLLRLPGMERLGTRAYRAVARRRYRLNKLFGMDLPACDNDNCKMLD